ncbi:MAG TPA: translation initiation factor IF-3 [Candidatus Paceibacterota bacterium]
MQAKTNNQITSPELRVIGASGENLGIITKEEALRLAAEKGLDLIEIAPTAKPPVAKIMSFDKFRYQKEKEYKKQRLAQKTAGMKQIRVSARAAENDLRVKAKKANEFLENGSNVEVMMILRGREKGNRAWAEQKLNEFLRMLDPESKVTSPARYTGRGFVVQVQKSAK